MNPGERLAHSAHCRCRFPVKGDCDPAPYVQFSAIFIATRGFRYRHRIGLRPVVCDVEQYRVLASPCDAAVWTERSELGLPIDVVHSDAVFAHGSATTRGIDDSRVVTSDNRAAASHPHGTRAGSNRGSPAGGFHAAPQRRRCPAGNDQRLVELGD